MTTYTTEELHNDTERVLATVKREGMSVIVSGDGSHFSLSVQMPASPPRTVSLTPPPESEKTADGAEPKLPFILERLRRQGMPWISDEDCEAVDKLVAGEYPVKGGQ